VLSSARQRLYPIVDPQVCEKYGRDARAVVSACLRGGATVLQLRVKSGSAAAFLELADAVVAAARAHEATVIINDRADIARAAGAAGVHVGQEDLPPDAVRTVLGRGWIGLSTHDQRQVDEALASAADYIAVGPISPTGTKDTGYSARGLNLVRYAAGRGKPIVAIGGITLERAPEVIGAGASAVAVITDLLTGDVEARVRQYLRALDSSA
jgi:thiamine-phosphate pyrophosphorylase